MTTVFTVMSYGGMALAVICFVMAVVLFIKWNIPKVFGDITGQTEKKAIEQIRQKGYEVNASRKMPFKSSTGTGKIKVRKMDDKEQTALDRKRARTTESTLTDKETGRESAVTREENVTTTVLQVYHPAEGTMFLMRESQEEETTILRGTSLVEETVILTDVLGKEGISSGDQRKEPEHLETSTIILKESSIDGVINIPDEVLTQPGTVAKVLNLVITHTEDVIL